MTPRVPKPKAEDSTPEVLKPKTEKAKVEKVKAEGKPKAKAEKTPKTEKSEKAAGEKAAKGMKAKAEKVDKADGKEKAAKGDKAAADKVGDGKGGEKVARDKVKAVAGDEAAELIVEYLRVQNRPFSATEVSANLHGKVTKTVADKTLKELGEKKIIGMHSTNKEHKGSQFVFWTLQDPADVATPEELAFMDTTISSLRSTMPSLKATLKATTTKLSALKSAPTTAQLQNMVDELRVENTAKVQKLNSFKTGDVKQVSKEEMVRVEKDFKYWSMKRKVRKVAYGDLEDILLGTGRSREDIREEAGVEVDEF